NGVRPCRNTTLSPSRKRLMVAEKRCQIRGDRRVRCIGQAEFLKPGPVLTRSGVSLDVWQEPREEEVFDLLTLNVRMQCAANQLRTRSWHTDSEMVWRPGTEERFLDVTAHTHQCVPLTRRQCAHSRSGEPRFEGVRQGEVEVVPTEDQVIADGDALELE